jgi:uncharacterized protein (DUF2132 family)
LHGITLATVLTQLVERHGWEEMGRRIRIRCFQFDPSIKSSLTFLRKTPWAREKLEQWFIRELPSAGSRVREAVPIQPATVDEDESAVVVERPEGEGDPGGEDQ